ncbi:Aldo/keto reductase [Auriscalpium vulgare]|uniref:Aldo/keto reductase n=1 Tax=Auriscalpium vulgare TaxID=40419 RepID=A0ACB8R1S7_9AGAM|nr:Aldo/keto reductase [Auriscalpium vulgare]
MLNRSSVRLPHCTRARASRSPFNHRALLSPSLSTLPHIPLRRLSSSQGNPAVVSAPVKLNDGTSIPWLGFGTGSALFGRNAELMVEAALRAGITHLDGAQAYSNEESLGAGIVASGRPRSELHVTTKLNRLDAGSTVRDSLLASLNKLKLDRVDLFLIHTPTAFEGPGRLKEIWKQFEEVKAEGLTRSIGVSNFRIPQLTQILDGATVPPAINQIEYHPYVFKDLIALRELHAQHGIVTESYGGLSPLFRAKGGPVDPVLARIAQRLSETAGQPYNEGHVLMLWQRAKGIVVVTTTTKESRLTSYLAVTNAPLLTSEEVAAIDEAGSQWHRRLYTASIPVTD